MKEIDLFDIQSTSPESEETLDVNGKVCTIVQWQAIVGRLYVKAAIHRRVTNKHEAWKKAKAIRDKINDVLREKLRDQIST